MTELASILPIKINSPIRLAVVAPGKPWPEILIASDEEVSDLQGYYSIRESGLDIAEDRLRFDPIRRLLEIYGLAKVVRPRFGVTDFWEEDDNDGSPVAKRRLFSIVFDLKDAPQSIDQRFFNYNIDFKRTLNRIASAYRRGDSEDIRYQSHILSAYIAQKLEFESTKAKNSKNSMVALSILTAIVAAAATIAGFLSRTG